MQRAALLRSLTLSIAAVSIAACGPNTHGKRSDPDNNGANNGSNNGGSNNGGSNNGGSNNGGSNNGVVNNGVVNNGVVNNGVVNNGVVNNGVSNNGVVNNGVSNNGINNGASNNGANNGAGCQPSPDFYGQIGSTEDHGGGTVTTSLSVDAGLDDVEAAAPPAPDNPMTGEDEGYLVLATPITVSGAIVTATSFGSRGDSRFWLEDANTTMQVFLDPLNPPVFGLRVGDEVSFDVHAVANFEGHIQIAEVANFAISSSGNGVPVREITTRELSMNDYGHIVRIAGVVGPGTPCGGTSTCYDLVHSGGVDTYRTASEFVAEGDCVTFVGPVYSFPGPQQAAANPQPQLDAINFGWALHEFQ